MTLINQINELHVQIGLQFPHSFNQIVSKTLNSKIISELETILSNHQTILDNLRELPELDTKIIYFRTMLDNNLGQPLSHIIHIPSKSDN